MGFSLFFKMYVFLFVLFVVVALTFNLTQELCFFSLAVESYISYMIRFVCLVLVVVGVFIVKSKIIHPLFFFIIVLFPGVIFLTSVHRGKNVYRAFLSLNGEIEKKFISSNHASKILIVGGVEYGGFSAELWGEASEGDVLVKEECGGYMIERAE